MKVALLIGPMSLGARTSVDIANFRSTPGMTGTDLGFVRLGECLTELGHDVMSLGRAEVTTPDHFDAAIAINEPDLLRNVDADVRTCAYWLNDMSFNRAGFHRYVDLFFSPSESHRQQVLTRPHWRRVEVSPQNPNGVELYQPEPDKWVAVELGCDPWRYGTSSPSTADEDSVWLPSVQKVPGKVIYCSSPDRGLHHLLSQWPAIKRAVPHANLHIYYTVQKWIDGLRGTPYPFPPVEPLRARALYVAEALRRMPDMGITIHDAVSRATIESEMASAECLAYPCDTVRWSEGFSCTLLEACAARACPVTLECDALPQVYGSVVPMVDRRCIGEWRDLVVRALTDRAWRDATNDKCAAFAAERTWMHTARRMMAEIERVRDGKSEKAA